MTDFILSSVLKILLVLIALGFSLFAFVLLRASIQGDFDPSENIVIGALGVMISLASVALWIAIFATWGMA